MISLCRGVLGLKAVRRAVEPHANTLITSAVESAISGLRAEGPTALNGKGDAGGPNAVTPSPTDSVGKFVADRLDDASSFLEPESGMTPTATHVEDMGDSGVAHSSPADAAPQGGHARASSSSEDIPPVAVSGAAPVTPSDDVGDEDADMSDSGSSGAGSVVEKE